MTTGTGDEMFPVAARALVTAARVQETPLADEFIADDRSIVLPSTFCGCADG